MNKQQIITITTDFGDDFSLSQLKAVILSLNPNAIIITVSNQISKFSILEGAFVISQAYSLFPKGTIHIGVIDPGVGTEREELIIKTKNHIFIGPNNGLFSQSVKKDSFNIYRINKKLVNKNHSNTFHGRDIFAKVAGLISLNVDIKTLADQITDTRFINLKPQANQVLYIDPYGNIKINNTCSDYKHGQKLKIQIKKNSLTIPFVKTFNDVHPGELLAYQGSNQILEIAENLGSGNAQLKLQVGDLIKVGLYGN